jgi:effector-binding domain-containing protein
MQAYVTIGDFSQMPHLSVKRSATATGSACWTVHSGSHANVDQTYGALGTYVAEHGHTLAGPVRKTYVVGPHDTADTSRWRTEICWPI